MIMRPQAAELRRRFCRYPGAPHRWWSPPHPARSGDLPSLWTAKRHELIGIDVRDSPHCRLGGCSRLPKSLISGFGQQPRGYLHRAVDPLIYRGGNASKHRQGGLPVDRPSGCPLRRGRGGRQRGPSAHRSLLRVRRRLPATLQMGGVNRAGRAGPSGPGRRRRRPGATPHPVAATRPGEHQVVGPGAGGQLPHDRRAYLLAHGHHADAGGALGLRLEPAAERAGLVADLKDLDAPQLRVDAAALLSYSAHS